MCIKFRKIIQKNYKLVLIPVNNPLNKNKQPSSSEEEKKLSEPDIIQVEDKGTVSICPSGTRLNEFNICEGKHYITC